MPKAAVVSDDGGPSTELHPISGAAGGNATGEVLRRLVARALAQQLGVRQGQHRRRILATV